MRRRGSNWVRWGNTRWQRLLTWGAGGLLGYGSPSIAMYRKGGRPTFREAWSGWFLATIRPPWL